MEVVFHMRAVAGTALNAGTIMSNIINSCYVLSAVLIGVYAMTNFHCGHLFPWTSQPWQKWNLEKII